MKRLIVIAALFVLLMEAAHAENLLQVYERAIDHDARLREAATSLKAIREVRPQAVARLLPSLSLKGEMYRNSVRSSFQGMPGGIGSNPLVFFAGGLNVDFWNSAASINLLQPVYHHDYWVQLAIADKQIAEAEAHFAAEQQSLIQRTAEAYFGILYGQDELASIEAELQALTRQLDMARARFDAGLNSITDVREAEAAFHQVRTRKIRAENQLQNMAANLELITGKAPGPLSKMGSKLLLNPPQPASMDDWISHARESNLALVAATSHRDALKERINQQFAGHYPRIDLIGSAGFTDNDRPYGISTEYQAIGMQMTVPVLEGGGVNARVRQARYEYEAAEEHLDGLRRSVTRDVGEAYRGVLSAISEIEALEATLKATDSALEAAQIGLEVGNRTMVDVLSEQAHSFQARRDHARARYDYVLSHFKLKWASGLLTAADLLSLNQGLEP